MSTQRATISLREIPAPLDQGRHQGGHGEQVQYVVAVVGEQDRLIAVQADDLAPACPRSPPELESSIACSSGVLASLVRHGAVRAVGHLLEQVQIGVELGLGSSRVGAWRSAASRARALRVGGR